MWGWSSGENIARQCRLPTNSEKKQKQQNNGSKQYKIIDQLYRITMSQWQYNEL